MKFELQNIEPTCLTSLAICPRQMLNRTRMYYLFVNLTPSPQMKILKLSFRVLEILKGKFEISA